MGTSHPLHELLRALSPGERVWMRASGRSLWPLVIDGDSLQVERCDEARCQLGDIAVVALGQVHFAHVVVATGPVRTASIVGQVDPLGAVLGRVVAVRRGGVVLAVPRVARHVLRFIPGLSPRLARVPGVRRVVHRVRDGAW